MAGAGAAAGPGASAGGAGMRSLAMLSHHPTPPGMVFPQIMGAMPSPGMGYHQQQQQQHPAPPPPSPPAFFPGSASLFEQLDKRVMVGGFLAHHEIEGGCRLCFHITACFRVHDVPGMVILYFLPSAIGSISVVKLCRWKGSSW